MERSLSVLLPVHNAEKMLANKVADVLDVLPDLTNQFDVLIIDDGSTDATADIGHELAMRYLQVSVVRHARAMGLAQSLHTGLGRTKGEIIFVHDDPQTLEAVDIVRLWNRRHEQDFAAAIRIPRAAAERPTWFSNLLPWKNAPRGTGFHMLRRRAIPGISARTMQRTDQPSPTAGRPARPNFLGELTRLALGE